MKLVVLSHGDGGQGRLSLLFSRLLGVTEKTFLKCF